MTSQIDRFRNGEAVQLKNGVSGRLNKEKKTIELSTGEVLDASRNKNLFPENEQQLKHVQQKEQIEKGVKESPFGEFGYQFSRQGLWGMGTDWIDYAALPENEYKAKKLAQQEVSQKISKRSPYISGAATAASFVPDIALTRGLSALKAAPLLTAAHAGPRILEEPAEVGKEALISAGGGYILDKATGGLSKIAQRRGEVRALPGQQAAVREQNVMGENLKKNMNELEKRQFNVKTQNVKNVNEMAKKDYQNELINRKNKIIQEEADIEAKNAAGKKVAEGVNQLQERQFDIFKRNVKNVNEDRLKQYNDQLVDRKNKIIQEKNEFIQKQAARDAEVVRLQNEARVAKVNRQENAEALDAKYKAEKLTAETENKRVTEKLKADTAQYEEDLKRLPQMQREAQKEYSENVIKNAEHISSSFPRESKIFSSQFGTNAFIDEAINKSALAGSTEANKASKILRSIFPEGEILSGKEISTRYRALEGAIQKASPEVKTILNDFKVNLGNRLPPILADNMAFSRVMKISKSQNKVPSLRLELSREIRSVLNEIPLSQTGLGSRGYVNNRLEANLDQIFREITPEDFINKFNSGEIRNKILKEIISPSDFEIGFGNAYKKGVRGTTQQLNELNLPINNPEIQKFNQFVEQFKPRLDRALSRSGMKIIGVETDAAKKLGAKVGQTYGVAPPVPVPKAPVGEPAVPIPNAPEALPQLPAYQAPPEITPPNVPPLPNKPNLMAQPTAPTPQTFNALPKPTPPPFPQQPNLMAQPMSPTPRSFTPQPEPTLPPPSGMAERAGDILEQNLLGGRDLINNPFTKLAGLKYALGKGALPVEAGYMALKGLTSPTQAGEVSRMTFQRGGIQAIDMWAQQLPSYHDGILEDPQDRRALTKQIEDASDIPLEQKAIIQSKVNRGKPLQQKL